MSVKTFFEWMYPELAGFDEAVTHARLQCAAKRVLDWKYKLVFALYASIAAGVLSEAGFVSFLMFAIPAIIVFLIWFTLRIRTYLRQSGATNA